MNESETNPLQCPFCGAPQRRFIPKGTSEVKCQYCGGVFLVPPSLGEGASHCPNHRDKLSTGLCNDCGGAFCMDCLRNYPLRTRERDKTILYLCSNCYRRRYINRANADIYGGLLFLVIGA